MAAVIDRQNPFDVAMGCLRKAREEIDRAAIEIERVHEINKLLMQQVQTMRTSFAAIQESVGGEAQHFQTFAKQNGETSEPPIPNFLRQAQN